MEATTYLVNGRVFAADDPALQGVLARIYGTPVRPRCMCAAGGVEMYVSKFNDFVLKRMPETGPRHGPSCPSYALPAGESGLGEVLGEAIIERSPDLVELRLNFPLTRYSGRSSAAGGPRSPTDVTVARRKLSLRGLLHYLWERAGFNRWSPRMQGKRSYGVLHKFLLQACQGLETKGLCLSDRVFIPEPFVLERAAAITQRRKEAMSILWSPDAQLQSMQLQSKMMIAIGEMKEFEATTFGYQLVFKHLPDCAFFIEQKAGERAQRVFQAELLAWRSGLVKLMVACLFYVKQAHWYQVDTLTMMMTTEQWIPLDHAYESPIAEKLVAEQRAFIKPLRYEARRIGAFPNLQLLDAGARPVALDVLSEFSTSQERTVKLKAIGDRKPPGWVWDTAQGSTIPELPPKDVAPVPEEPAQAAARLSAATAR